LGLLIPVIGRRACHAGVWRVVYYHPVRLGRMS
jgi:hypothetical protein